MTISHSQILNNSVIFNIINIILPVTVYLDNIKYSIISPVTMAMIIAILSGSSTVNGVNIVFQCRPECWISRLTMRLSPRAIQVAGSIHDTILIALLKYTSLKENL